MFSLFKKNDDSLDKGLEAGQQIANQGDTIDTVSWSMVDRIAAENHLDDYEFAFGVQAALTGESYCVTCRCFQPAEHECLD